MTDLNVLLGAILAAGVAAGLTLLVVGVRGVQVDPTRPPSRLQVFLKAERSPWTWARLAGAVLLAVLVESVTGWPVAALGLGGLVAGWPALTGGSAEEQAQIARLEAVVTWCESLRDTTVAHAGLEQAIPATAANTAPAIRPALARLCAQLRSQVPLEQALGDLAEQLHHSADLIIAALQLNAGTRGDGLVGVLTNLALTGREELDLRRKITASRAGDRRAVQLMLGIVGAVAAFLVLFSAAYTAPYRGVVGQLWLAVVLALFATSFLWIRRLAAARPPVPFLPVAGQQPDRLEQAIIEALTTPTPAASAPVRQVGRS